MPTNNHTPNAEPCSADHPLDLIIVGAGLSGTDLAHHVNRNFPHWRWRVFDSNSDIGGTWNTFRYPGIRSDSDMATFAFPFQPWPHKGTLGEGKDIQEYIRTEARKTGMLDRLHLRSWVKAANYHSDKELWEVTVETTSPEAGPNSEGKTGAELASGEKTTSTHWTRRLHYASGYYRHHQGHTANIPGLANFRGQLIHPQRWPENQQVKGKNVIIIGSGATAVTLLPALHKQGATVTMLQRTPTYVAPLPEFDTISTILGSIMPKRMAFPIARRLHIFRDMAQYHICQTAPRLAKAFFWTLNRRFISRGMIKEHFTPPYNPWDQRVCKAPGGDIFRALNHGANVVTGKIADVKADGIALQDGRFLPADIIITATGLELEAFGQSNISVDGTPMPASEQVAYRGILIAGLPNFSTTIGYLNASWTLRADLVSRYLVQLWKWMDRRGLRTAEPVLPSDMRADAPLLGWSSGYIQRAEHRLPTQGTQDPWVYEQDYLKEYRTLMHKDHTKDMVFA